jgi:stage II sporulation protein D
MRQSAAAALALTVLLFGGAYLAAGKHPAQETEPDGGAVREQSAQGQKDGGVQLAVKNGDAVEIMALDVYLQGVVRGEMPASFELEALKAQAAAERTYIYYQLAAGRKEAHPNADVCTDPSCCNAWLSEEAAREKWGGDFDGWESRIEEAVAATDGQVALYDGQPILAVFHSSSAGKTAGAGDVWSGDMPYLRSVDSPEGEETVPNYYSAAEFTAAEAKALLAQAHPELTFSGGPDKWFGAVEKDESGRVGTVEVCGAPLRGVEVRRIFSLRSACFTIDAAADRVTFRVTGYGHGVGMSQYGANELARQGRTWQEILLWYYADITIGPAPETVQTAENVIN